VWDLRAAVGRMRVAATRRCGGIIEERRRSRRSADAAKHFDDAREQKLLPMLAFRDVHSQ
jgi:hypothetical protein